MRSTKEPRSLSRRLTQVVDLQIPPAVNGTQNAHGEPSAGWTTEFANLRAEVKKNAGTLELKADQLQQAATWMVTMRADPNIVINATKRIRWTDRFGVAHLLYIEHTLSPQGVREDELTISCHEAP